MGFLDKKERIFDVVLTDKGRELLSKNQLKIEYYAFSDDGIDYSGSLNISRIYTSSSYDDIVYRNHNFFESDQKVADSKGKVFGRRNLDFNSYIFTIPATNEVLPSFVTSQDEDVEFELNRDYKLANIKTIKTIVKQTRKPEAAIFKTELKKQDTVSKEETFIREQRILKILGR